MLYFQDGPLTVRPLEQEDCEAFPRCFAAQGWEKPRALFRRYLEEQGSCLLYTSPIPRDTR